MPTYDNNGNNISKSCGTSHDVYSYNLYNQLTGNVINNVNATYTYNAKGIRTSKTVGNNTTRFILDGGNVAAEVKGAAVTDYVRGINLICTDSEYYIYNAHGDVVSLTSSAGIVTKTYDYDAFGNEAEPSDADTNPFRYCGEYYDTETGTYYLRARYYDPTIGRFTAEDTHWNTANMIYGDNPQKINEREDALGLKRYSYAPQISAVMQSGNLYVYCGGNPVERFDYSGRFFISTTLLLIAGGALLGGVIGGLVGNHVANEKGATGWEKVGYIAGGAIVGGVAGAIVGDLIAPTVISATSVTGVLVTNAGIDITYSASGTVGTTILNSWQEAESHIRQINNAVKHTFKVDGYRSRIADGYNNAKKIVYEVKYGYTALSEFIKSEIDRDAWLLNNDPGVRRVEWHFFESQITGKGGVSTSLLNYLLENHINVYFH